MRERVHRAGPQLRLGLARHRVRVGHHQRRAHQPPRPLLGPGGQPVDAGHLGAGHRRRDRRDPGAADRGDRLRGVDHAAAAEGDEVSAPRLVEQPRRRPPEPRPARPRGRASAAPRASRAPASARSVLSSAKRLEAVLARGAPTRAAERPARKTTVRSASRQTKSASAPRRRFCHVLVATRGLTIGRRFGSTSSRRCSKSGGSESFSPRLSSGSSTVKPGPRVAISNRTPLGSRK